MKNTVMIIRGQLNEGPDSPEWGKDGEARLQEQGKRSGEKTEMV